MSINYYIKIEIILEIGAGVKNKGKEKGKVNERNKKKEKTYKNKK